MQQSVEHSPNLIGTLQRYADLFTFAPVGYVVLGKDLHVTDINRAAAAMIGRPRSSLVGQPFASWLVRSEIVKFAAHVTEACRSDRTVSSVLRLEDRDGRERAVRIDSVSLVDRPSGQRGYQMALVDLTDAP